MRETFGKIIGKTVKTDEEYWGTGAKFRHSSVGLAIAVVAGVCYNRLHHKNK